MSTSRADAVDGAGPDALASAVVRIHDRRGVPVGLGFLVTADRILTCAHVVSAALGLPPETEPDADARVDVDLPLLANPLLTDPLAAADGTGGTGGTGGTRVPTTVERWAPAHPHGAGDVAVLHLSAPLPGARPIRIVESSDVWGHTVRAYGLPSGRPGGVWHSGVLRARQANGWIQADLAANGYRVSPGFSGGPVWDEQLDGVVGMMAVAETGDPPSGYLIPAEGLASVWPELRELALPPSPFRSLRPLQESDAPVFHGRRAETAEVTALVARERWTTLVGPSGSGKSSLAMAGVIPRLHAQGMTAVVIRPNAGTTPLSALAAALSPLLEPDLTELGRLERLPALVGLLRAQGLGDLAALLLARLGTDQLIVVVDQFEEMLTGADPAAVDELAAVLFGPSLPGTVHVLTTLRADYLEAALAHPSLGRACSRQVYALGPMTGDQLREVVTAPVAAIPSVRYEAHLVDRILTDAGGEAGALPLLGFTLDLLWKRQAAGVLSHRAYEEIGHVSGALGEYAEQAWDRHVSAGEEPAARRLFTRLVRVPLGAPGATRRTVPRQELAEDEWHIAQRLAGTRLLVIDHSAEGVETVELAHEALITAWSRLRDWVGEDRAFLEWRESVRHDRRRWDHAGQPADLLPTGPTLDTARTWQRERGAELSEAERSYLELARRHHRARGRRRRTFRTVLVAVITVSLALGVLFATARRDAAERQADSDSRALVQASQDDMAYDPVRAVMMALAAYRTKPTPEARNQLMRQYLLRAGADSLFSGMSGTGGTFSTSRDGDVVLSRDAMAHVVLFVRGRDGTVHSRPVPAQYAFYLMVSPDGRRAGFVADDGTGGWFDVDKESTAPIGQVHQLPRVDGVLQISSAPADATAMSPDGRYIAVPTRDSLVWWDLDAGTIAGRVPAPQNMGSGLWFGSDGHSLLVRTSNGSTGLASVDMAGGAARTVVVPADHQGILPSGDRTTVAVVQTHESGQGSGTKSTVRLIRVSDGSVVGKPYETTETIAPATELIAANADGHRIVINEATKLTLLDLDRGKAVALVDEPGRLYEHASVLLSTGGKEYLAGQGRSSISYTEIPAGEEDAAAADTVHLSRDGRKITIRLTGGTDLELREPGLDLGRLLTRTALPQPAWKGKGDRLLSNRDDTLIALRDGPNTVSVRDASTLRAVARITVAPPPPVDSAAEDFSYFFDGADRLVTVSGTQIQQWEARTGVRLAQYDAAAFHPRADKPGTPQMYVGPYWQEGKLTVVVHDDPVIRVVDIGTGHTVTSLNPGITDLIAARFDESGRYLAVLRRNSVIELWRLDPLQREIGPLPTTSTPGQNAAITRFVDTQGHFMIAANNSIRIYQVGGQPSVDSYDFRNVTDNSLQEPLTFLDATNDGKTFLIRTENDYVHRIVLDPDAWQRSLCRIINYRSFTTDERRTLPVRVPDGPLCPPTKP
ncbi:trypsin-like peptidase domain-containing protein [Kitasatospora sp. NPDC059811]|uniref:nSTAND1 domain-containing NTPase n=1 Tax=Streptomycetaceae TaxID=2062 RepID=UPI0007AF6DAB|nr:trypsin-like peptidase domain-containing protein [Streptomyces sp. MJM8645]